MKSACSTNMDTVDIEKIAKKNFSPKSVNKPSLQNNKKNCCKRHPKTCKKNPTERGCRFGSSCSYIHSKPNVLPYG